MPVSTPTPHQIREITPAQSLALTDDDVEFRRPRRLWSPGCAIGTRL